MDSQRTHLTFTQWWAVAGLAALGLMLVAVVWDVLVFCVLRRWFRILPIWSWTTWGLMAVLCVALLPVLPDPWTYHLTKEWPLVFVTLPLALWLLRWETKHYIWSVAAKIAAYENYIAANGGQVHGNPQRGGLGA